MEGTYREALANELYQTRGIKFNVLLFSCRVDMDDTNVLHTSGSEGMELNMLS